MLRKAKIEQMVKRYIDCKSTMFQYFGAYVVAPIDLFGLRLVRVLKTSVSEIEIDSKEVVGRGRSSGLGEGKELLVKMEWK